MYSFLSEAKLGEGDSEKAQLVARGDLQCPGEDYRETYAPVVKLVSLRILPDLGKTTEPPHRTLGYCFGLFTW